MTFYTQDSQYSGTLYVDSNGDFTSSGFTGYTSQGSYPIDVNGWMSGSSVGVTETASYDNGAGSIYATGSGTFDDGSFPSATSASGSISGTITDPLGSRSFSMTWTATKTSGDSGGGDFFGGSDLTEDDFYAVFIAGMVGIAFIAVIVTVVLAVRNSNKAKSRQNLQGSMGPHPQPPPQWRKTRPRNYQYQQPPPPNPQTPPNLQGSWTPQPITADTAVPITGQGTSVASSELGSLPFLRGLWEKGRATLTWGTPPYNSQKYVLLGYDISQMTYGPTSTAAQNVYLGRVSANQNQTFIQPFNQTYRWNTAGDIGGFRVDPVYGQLNSSGQVVNPFQHGGLGIRVGEPFGTFGGGP
jgi:hypothetical protein